jgi:hypothetical protein
MTTTNKTEAARRNHDAARRAAYIAALGMAPEPKNAPYAERYAASTGEMWGWLARDRGVEAADAIFPRFTT